MKCKIHIGSCIAAVWGIFLVGAGVAFNAGAQLGNDAVGIFYDGIRNILNLSGEQLGIASNVVNLATVLLLWFVGRRYVNIGTLIYILPYGFFVDLGTELYAKLLGTGEIFTRCVGAVSGSLFICLGVALFIVADIGVDPLTGLALWIGEKLHWPYRRAKVLFDVCLTAMGFLMGGRIGMVTLVVSVTGGPVIQFLVDAIRKIQTTLKVRWKAAEVEG